MLVHWMKVVERKKLCTPASVIRTVREANPQPKFAKELFLPARNRLIINIFN